MATNRKKAKSVKRTALKARDSSGAKRLGRLGFAAKGLLYLLIAFLSLRVAFGADEQTDDRKSALKTVAEQPLGELALAVLAAGLAGYAVWRAIEAVAGPRGEDGVKALGWRAASAGKSVLYGYTCWFALSALGGSAGGQKQEEKRQVADALSFSGGRYLVLFVGLGFLAAGLYNLYQGLSARFREKLQEGWMHKGSLRLAVAVGVLGHVARAVVFTLVGVFLARAAWQHDASEAGGLDEALAAIVNLAYGPFLLGVVGVGLGAYGAYALAEARWRKLPSK